ncbi:MAG: M20/M25/M40 family metallo-hydrolase [Chloroflexota bacterium]|nr:M20/M25/M40 family metallo-hydrolase [Chloroflexota bacterium]
MTPITVDADYVLECLTALVAIPSINPTMGEGGGAEAEVALWLAEECNELGFSVEMHDVTPGRPNVIARRRGTGGGRSLLLTGHTDTVDVVGMDAPFSAEVRDGRLYGRGAQDMKGGLAAILGAAEALSGWSLRGDLILAFAVDEEYASIGTLALVERLRADAAILTEPTDERLCIAHKGFAWLTLATRGHAAHGSLFETGIDAIAHMGWLIESMRRFESELFPGTIHPLLGRSSVHASLIDGGVGLSTYPDRCVMQVEHRLLPDQTAESARDLWQAEIDRLRVIVPGFDADVTIDLERPGYEIPSDAPIVLALDHALRTQGVTPELWGMPAWLDSAILGRAGIPTVIYGPRGAGMHGLEEYVELDSVVRCAAVIAEAAAGWVG